MSGAEEPIGWGIDDLALYVPPARGDGGSHRVRVASHRFWVDGEGRPLRTVAFLDERGKPYDVLEAHLAHCDSEFRLIGELPEHLQVAAGQGKRWDHWVDPAKSAGETMAWPEAPSGDAGLTERHLQDLDEAFAARKASREALGLRDVKTAREESARAAGLVLKVELDLVARRELADAQRHQVEAEALAGIRVQVAEADAKRRSELRSAELGFTVDLDPEAQPVIVSSEVEEDYLAFGPKGVQIRKRRVRRLRVITPDGLFAMQDSGRLTGADVDACLTYRLLFEATERSVRSCMNMDRKGGMAAGAEERKNAQWADRLEIERRAKEHPARNGFEIMALQEICGRRRSVNDLVSGGHKRYKLGAALERVAELIRAWLKEPRERP